MHQLNEFVPWNSMRISLPVFVKFCRPRPLSGVKELRSIKSRLDWIHTESNSCLNVPATLIFVWASFNYSPKILSYRKINAVLKKEKKDCIKQRVGVRNLNSYGYNGAFSSTKSLAFYDPLVSEISVKRHERRPTLNVQSDWRRALCQHYVIGKVTLPSNIL